MGAGEAWDGEIKIEEYIKRVNIGGAIKMTKIDENIGWVIDEILKRSYSDIVHGKLQSALLRCWWKGRLR